MTTTPVHLYCFGQPDPRYPTGPPRWVPGDQHPRAALRRLRGLRVETMPTGFSTVARNLALGMRAIRQPYRLRVEPTPPPAGALVGIIHGTHEEVCRIAERGPCVTGPGVLSVPEQWPGLFDETQAALHVSASEWAADLLRRAWPDRVRVWPVGIDTERFRPRPETATTTDVLLYDKIRWDRPRVEAELLTPIRDHLHALGLSVETIRYKQHTPSEYAAALARCRTMVFVCEHETQGIACEEALAAGVPVLAWDPGEWMDPRRPSFGIGPTPATTVPYFDERCGDRFRDAADFPDALGGFLERAASGAYAPRDYVLEHLTLDRCARRYVDLLVEAADQTA